jgi:hypothetical protein
MNGPTLPIQLLAREAGDVARAALRRAALAGAALLIAALGAGFLILAADLGLHLLGPVLAALALGTVLLAVSAGLVLALRARSARSRPMSHADPRQRQSATAPPAPPAPADAATMAVFTMAFPIGRRLAGRWSQARES